MELLSILTLYNNYPDIFDDMYIPEGMDKDLLINSITTELAAVSYTHLTLPTKA